MQSNKIIIGIILVFILAIGYVMFMTEQAPDSATDVMESNEAMMENEGAMMEEEADVMMADEAMMEGDSMMKSDEASAAGTYTTYSPDKLAMATDGKVVLFFKASWCPSCRALDADIKENSNNIPGDLTILEVDFDAATDLKRKYGVTMQHTIVQVDAQGNMITKWSGGNMLSDLVSRVN